jgi:hypothetical protein
MFFSTVACLIGILVGLHFRVLALVPVTLAVVFAAGVGAMAGGEAASAVLMGTITSAIGLQVGYVIGLMARAQFGLLFFAHCCPAIKTRAGPVGDLFLAFKCQRAHSFEERSTPFMASAARCAQK